MAIQIFTVFFFLFALIETTAGSVNLDVHPTDINPGLTQSLTVNCSFTFAQASDISGIISLILSKNVVEENNQEKFQDLISINTFSPDQINVISPVNGSMLGHISNDGKSFLTIQWTYPGNDQAGLYRCEANGMDSSGHPSQVFKTAMVTSEQPDMGQLIDKVSDLQRQLVSQENLTYHLTSQLHHQENMITQQSHLIDTLLSLTKNQSDMINKQQSQLDLMKYADIFHVSNIYNNHVYLLSKADWTDATVAEETCKEHNGYLAQIDDSGEDTFINQFLNSNSGFNVILVSGTDEGHEGRWTYTGTDIDMTYINWRAGEPDQPDLNCMEKYRGNQWQFANYPCIHIYTGKKFLCEVSLQ